MWKRFSEQLMSTTNYITTISFHKDVCRCRCRRWRLTLIAAAAAIRCGTQCFSVSTHWVSHGRQELNTTVCPVVISCHVYALMRLSFSVFHFFFGHRMSKITNDGLTRSGTGCFIAVPIWHSGRQMVKLFKLLKSRLKRDRKIATRTECVIASWNL